MVKKTSNQIEKLKARIVELEDAHKRVLADYHNQDRRHKDQESMLIKMAAASLLEKLLLSLDALEMAQTHLKDKGLQMVIDQFKTTLSSEGLIVIESDGQEFDPLTMDCVEVVAGEKDKVIETTLLGYFLFDKVLRPAKVKVGSGDPSKNLDNNS